MKFIPSPIFDIHASTETPEYFTVLCQAKPRGKKMFCAENGEIVKCQSMDEAKRKAKEMETNYLASQK